MEVEIRQGQMIDALLRQKGYTQRRFADKVGVSPQSVNAWVKGKKRIDPENLPTVAAALGITVDTLLAGKLPDPSAPTPSPHYIELPYIAVLARPNFIDVATQGKAFSYPDTYRVIAEPEVNYDGQVVIEADGDSMEPYYSAGTKVRCQPVPASDWEFINSGVYAVNYAKNFVIKRIKGNEFRSGFLTLHSDNVDTGGSTQVPVEQLHHIWKVLRIVDAPAR